MGIFGEKQNDKKKVESKEPGINPALKMMVMRMLPLIEGKLQAIDPAVVKMIESVVLLPGEARATFILDVNSEGEAYIFTCALSAENNVLRVVKKQKLTELITELLSQIK